MSNVAPGWYSDPTNPLQERLWDGSEWVDRVRPRPPADMPQAFEDLVMQAARAKLAFDNGDMNKSQYAMVLRGLRLVAPDGTEWTTGAASGTWYCRPIGGAWVRATPPSEEKPGTAVVARTVVQRDVAIPVTAADTVPSRRDKVESGHRSKRDVVRALDTYSPCYISGDLLDLSLRRFEQQRPEHAANLKIAHRDLRYLLDNHAGPVREQLLKDSPDALSGLSEQQQRDYVTLNTAYSFLHTRRVPPSHNSVVNGLSLVVDLALESFERYEAIRPGEAPLPDSVMQRASEYHSACEHYIRSTQALTWMFTDESLLSILRTLATEGPLTKLEYDLVVEGAPSMIPEIGFANPVHSDYLQRDTEQRWSVTQLGLKSVQKGRLAPVPGQALRSDEPSWINRDPGGSW